jgi:hypothetical protein
LREHGVVELGAADDADLIHARRFRHRAGGSEHGGEIGVNPGVICFEIGITREDKVLATGQRLLRQRVPGLAAHEHGLADGGGFETLHVGREPPRQRAITADDAVLRDSDDEGEFGSHGCEPPCRSASARSARASSRCCS